jgi:hypothetical protein
MLHLEHFVMENSIKPQSAAENPAPRMSAGVVLHHK